MFSSNYPTPLAPHTLPASATLDCIPRSYYITTLPMRPARVHRTCGVAVAAGQTVAAYLPTRPQCQRTANAREPKQGASLPPDGRVEMTSLNLFYLGGVFATETMHPPGTCGGGEYT
ncbi:hypothetical protein PMIN03_000594 [Paraphaeosphaeria minitans]